MKIYDLSFPVYTGMPVFPETPPVEVNITHTIDKNNFRMGQLIINSHAGTHADAPAHFIPNAQGFESMSVEKYVGPALVVNLSFKKAKEPLTIADLKPFAERIKPGVRLIIRTDWDKHYGSEGYFSEYPFITLELAQWLVEQGIILLGLDMASLNQELYIEVHQAFLKAKIAVIESLCNLNLLNKDEIFFVAPPVNFIGADGIPVRALAIDFSSEN